jgi:hypothetical protein
VPLGRGLGARRGFRFELAARQIDHKLGELRGIAGAFFHFKYHFNTTTTQKLAIPSTNNQPVV